MNKAAKILVVDDEDMALRNLEHVLRKVGHSITTASNGTNALALLNAGDFDVIITDLRMEGIDGLKILEHCKEQHPIAEVIMITGYATLDSAVEAMKRGAYHYIAKPYRVDEVRRIVAEAAEKVRLKRENRKLKADLNEYRTNRGTQIITQDGTMLKLLDTARQVATTGCNVLLLGESGTGKELFARFIHEQSQRRDKPLVAVNCGAFGEDLLVNELFGHEKGAFTGANASKPGLMETAHTGTLFLDEITEMSLTMQVKLVRVIQEREVLRLGSTRPIHVDVRFIAASNRTIEDVLASGEFREDLYYRLNVVTFTMPPLSDRKGDIPVLCEYFLAKHAVLMGKDPPTLSDEVLAILKKHDFPGNVRELENIIQRGVALARGNAIEIKHLPEDLQHNPVATPAKPASGRRPTLEEQEVRYIRQVLEEANGNRTLAAQVLGIDRVSLWRKIKKYELE